MIGYVRGVVTHLFKDACYVDVHGVGYRVYVPTTTRQLLVEGEESTLFTTTLFKDCCVAGCSNSLIICCDCSVGIVFTGLDKTGLLAFSPFGLVSGNS